MKRVSIIFLSFLLCNLVLGQSKFINIIRDDGGSTSLSQQDVDSIIYSNYDVYGNEYKDIYTQIIFSKGKMYRIPLNSIDSVSFNQDSEIDNKNHIYYHVESIENEESGIDSVMVASNGYYYLLRTNEDQTISLLIDSISDGSYENAIIAHFDSLGNVVSILTNNGLACFSYRDNIVDVTINNNGQIETHYDINYSLAPAMSRRKAGVPQYHFWDRVNKVNSLIGLFQSASNPITFFNNLHSLFWQGGVDLFNNSDASFVVSMAGEAFNDLGQYAVAGKIDWRLILIRIGMNLLNYEENKTNDLRLASYRFFAGNCEIETLGCERVNENSYTFKMNVSNLSSIPNEYKNKNYYGLVIKKVPLDGRMGNLNIYEKGTDVYYAKLTKEGILDFTINTIERGYKYYYNSFIMTPVEEEIYRNGTGNKLLDSYINTIGHQYFSWIYYGDEKVFTPPFVEIRDFKQNTCVYLGNNEMEVEFDVKADVPYFNGDNIVNSWGLEVSTESNSMWQRYYADFAKKELFVKHKSIIPKTEFDSNVGKTKIVVTPFTMNYLSLTTYWDAKEYDLIWGFNINTEKTNESSISYESATISGSSDGFVITGSNGIELGFCYSKSTTLPNVGNSNFVMGSLDGGFSSGTPGRNFFSSTISNLEPNTIYYYRACAKIDGQYYYAENTESFRTKKKKDPDPEPLPITGGHYNESVNSATIECTFNSVSAGVECGYYLNDVPHSLGNVSGKQTISLTGLEPNTEYEYNAYVVFQGQTKKGIPDSFKTISPLPTTGGHYNEALTSATVECLYANVPNGAECGVELIKDTEGTFSPSIATVPIGNVTGDQMIPLTNLEPDTKYYYQAYIKYKGKTYYNPSPNDEKEFKTLKPLATTGDCLSSTSTSAVVNVIYANVPEGASCRVNYYSKTGSLFDQGYKDLGEVSGSHDVLLDNLLPATEYQYYAYIIYNGKSYDGLERNFSTKTPEAWVGEVEDKERDITCTEINNIPYGFSNVPEEETCNIVLSTEDGEKYYFPIDSYSSGIYSGFSNLVPDTRYSYYTCFSNDKWKSNIVEFTTKAPSATLIDVTEVEEEQATILFKITRMPNDATAQIKLVDNNGNPLYYNISDGQTELVVGYLTPSTTYDATIIICYADKSWESNSLSFTTKTPPTPVATTGECSSVTKNSATVSCTYENVPEGGVCGVEYTWNGGSTKQAVGNSNGTQSITLSGLKPGTNYTYCAYIEANGTTYYGGDKTFTTETPSLAGTWSCSITRSNGDSESWTITLTEDGNGSASRTDTSSATYEASWGLGADGKASVSFAYIVSTPQRFSYQTYSLWGTVNNLDSPSSISGNGEYRIGNDIAESGPYALTFSMSK